MGRQLLHPSALKTLAAMQTYRYGDVRHGSESCRQAKRTVGLVVASAFARENTSLMTPL
jgi:hypothetical protein